MSIEAGRPGHWSIQEIPYDAIDRQRARADPCLLYLVTGASFVEITSDLCAGNLVAFFAGDGGLERWLAEGWEPDEKQHGQALRLYVETVWPKFDWSRPYQGFYAEYGQRKPAGQRACSSTASHCASVPNWRKKSGIDKPGWNWTRFIGMAHPLLRT